MTEAAGFPSAPLFTFVAVTTIGSALHELVAGTLLRSASILDTFDSVSFLSGILADAALGEKAHVAALAAVNVYGDTPYFADRLRATIRALDDPYGSVRENAAVILCQSALRVHSGVLSETELNHIRESLARIAAGATGPLVRQAVQSYLERR